MGYIALYRKYRPTRMDQVYGQNANIKILFNSIKEKKVSHAYLFFGPRGTGKTSTARLFSKLINCQNQDDNCTVCNSCKAYFENNNSDIIEIDAASNNSVEEIRTIREKVNLLPSFSKHKIYIIDEVHMLSSGAFNALLKTLESPPAHVIFILATTEYYKVPNTIISRCQTIEFKRISPEDIYKCLLNIVSSEKIIIEDEVLNNIANYSNGGLRDAIGLLDKLNCYCENKITLVDFYELTNICNPKNVEILFNNIYSNKLKESLEVINIINKNGKNIQIVINDLLEQAKNYYLTNSYDSKTLQIINSLMILQSNMQKYQNEKLALEITIINMISKNMDKLEESSNNKIISREIISNTKSENQILPENKLYNKYKNIIIFNTLSTANKNTLIEYKKIIEEAFNNGTFSSKYKFLLDCKVGIASEKNVIMVFKYSSQAEIANENLKDTNIFLNKIFNKSINFIFVNENEFNEIKQNYIKNKQESKKYKYVDINLLKLNDETKIVKTMENANNIVTNAMELFDKNIIEIEGE